MSSGSGSATASLRELALTHRSFAFETRSARPTTSGSSSSATRSSGSSSRMLAFREFPEMPEGELAKLRAAIVNMGALADVARDLGLGRFVLLGKGEEMSGGRDKSSILADALEALLGAIYLDRGLPVGAQADRAGVPPADDRVRPRRGRARLQDDPAGARLGGGARASPSTGSGNAGPTTRRSSRRRCSSAASRGAAASAARRRRPSSRRPTRRTSVCRAGARGPPEHGARAARPRERQLKGSLGGASRSRGDASRPREGRRGSQGRRAPRCARRGTRCA